MNAHKLLKKSPSKRILFFTFGIGCLLSLATTGLHSLARFKNIQKTFIEDQERSHGLLEPDLRKVIINEFLSLLATRLLEYLGIALIVLLILRKINEQQVYRAQLSADLAKTELQQRTLEVSNGLIHSIGNMLMVLRAHIDRMEKSFEDHASTFSEQEMEKFKSYKTKADRVYASNLELLRTQQNNAKANSAVEEINIKEVVEDIGVLLDRRFHELVNLEMDFKEPKVYANRSQLTLVLLNLIKNATEAIEKSKTKNPVITLESFISNENTILQVKDNGIGIAEDQLDLLFSYGKSGKTNGHGFGLHSSRSIVRSWGGDIDAIPSTQSHHAGAVFKITLPRLPLDREASDLRSLA